MKEAHSIAELNESLDRYTPVTAGEVMQERIFALRAGDGSWWDHPIDTVTFVGREPNGRGKIINMTREYVSVLRSPIIGGALSVPAATYESLPGRDLDARTIEDATQGPMTMPEAWENQVLLALADQSKILLANYVDAATAQSSKRDPHAFTGSTSYGYKKIHSVCVAKPTNDYLLWPVRFEAVNRPLRVAHSATRPPNRMRRHFMLRDSL